MVNFTGFLGIILRFQKANLGHLIAHLWTPKKATTHPPSTKKCHQSKNRFQHVSEIINWNCLVTKSTKKNESWFESFIKTQSQSVKKNNSASYIYIHCCILKHTKSESIKIELHFIMCYKYDVINKQGLTLKLNRNLFFVMMKVKLLIYSELLNQKKERYSLWFQIVQFLTFYKTLGFHFLFNLKVFHFEGFSFALFADFVFM